MTTVLSNVSYANNEYTVTGTTGSATYLQPTTGSYYLQYNLYITPSFLHNYAVSVKDATSNLTVTLASSNLSISNKTSNLCSVFTPYLMATAYNTLGINRYDNSVLVSVNNSNILRLTSSNELPQAFDNSVIQITASNTNRWSNVSYLSIGVTSSPMEFQKSVKVLTTLSSSNITSCNILTMTSNISSASNTATWSSNNLYPRSGGAAINGNVGIKISPSYELDIAGQNMRLQGGAGNPTTFLLNSTGAANTQSIVQFVNSGHRIACADSNWEGQTRPGSGHNIFYTSGGHVFSGPVVWNGTIGGSAITALSNVAMYGSNTSIWSSNTVYTVSNAFYTSTTGGTASWASNTATWSSNNLYQKTGGTITGSMYIQGDIYKNIPSYDPSYGDFSQFTISTNNNVVGTTWQSQLKLGVTNCNDGMGYIQTINPWVGMPNLVLQPNAGNVAVGKSNPLYKLDVAGNSRFNNGVVGDCGHGTAYSAFCHSSSFSTGGCALLHQDIGETYLNCASGRNIRFRQNNVDMGIWDTNGRLGVNTTTPGYTLHVAGTFYVVNVNSPTIDNLSNAAYPAYGKSIWGSNTAVSASNVSIWSSNQFGGWLGYPLSFPNAVGWWNSVVPLSGAGYALMQTDIGATAVNAYESNAVCIRSHNRNVACFSNYTGDLLGSMTVRSNLNVEQYTTLKKGIAGATGTFTHIPFSGDGKKNIRGDVILADNGGNVCIGTTSGGDKLTVNGTTATSSLRINNGALLSHLQVLSATIPSNGSGKLILTLSGTYPSTYEVFPTVRTSDTVSDNFCVTVMSTSTSQIKLSVVRTDGNSWGNAAELTLLLVG